MPNQTRVRMGLGNQNLGQEDFFHNTSELIAYPAFDMVGGEPEFHGLKGQYG
jgi:hypothetical protein